MKPATIFSFFVFLASVGFELGSLFCNSMVSITGIKIGILTDLDSLKNDDFMKIADLENGLALAVGISQYLIAISAIVILILFALHLLGCCIEHRYMRYIVCTMSLFNSLLIGAVLVMFIVSFRGLFATKISDFINTLSSAIANKNLNLVELSTSFYLLCAAFCSNIISAILQSYNVPVKPNRYVNLI